MKTFHLPDLGEGLQEAEIVSWHVGEGDHVVVDQPLLSVETAKAIVDVPSPFAGRVARLHVKAGDIVPLASALIDIDDGEAGDSGTVVGDVKAVSESVREDIEPAPAAAGRGVRAMPAVRALASKLGIDLAIVTPSGPDGTILASDVERVSKILASVTPMETLRGPRRAMAQIMARAHEEVAAVTLTEDADIHGWAAGEDTTWRLIRAIVAACRAVPVLNAWYDAKALGIRKLAQVDLGIALDMADALFVPVLRDVGGRDKDDLRAAIEQMKIDVGNRAVAPEDLRGNTITLSNFGMVAGRYASPVIVPPTVAIVGAGRARKQPVAVGDQVAVHRLLPMSLTFDHRAATGIEAARFLKVLIADLEAGA
ncbi:dihydrolipoamide acetyltransferase family protein [Microvirgula aerodenitrificans]|uniref:dihydrolipoamide acetyltransferase family protein n=1 Tax=Microvirgula aerodenitrificans TaxID=57480 RepID=UPI00248F06B7|nr:dihydrolipoamide acetyltransferase family protein [Microvirgula aerodenitrificans]